MVLSLPCRSSECSNGSERAKRGKTHLATPRKTVRYNWVSNELTRLRSREESRQFTAHWYPTGLMIFFRHMRTTQERRRWFADLADVVLRRARGPRLLPNLWDD